MDSLANLEILHNVALHNGIINQIVDDCAAFFVEEGKKIDFLESICEFLVRRSAAPFRSSIMHMLFKFYQANVFNLDLIISVFKSFKTNPTSYEQVLLYLFIWFAPEIEDMDMELFEHVLNTDENVVNGLFPTLRNFFYSFEQLSNNEYRLLKLLRESSPLLKTISAVLQRDDIELLKVASSKPGFDVNSVISPSIYEPSFYTNNSPTLVMYSCFYKSINCLNLLLDLGADLNLTDSEGNTIIDFACASGSLEICELLISKGIDISSGVFAAAEFGNLDVLYRLEKDYMIDYSKIHDKKGSLLHRAAFSGSIDVIKFCIEKNIDFYTLDKKVRISVFKNHVYIYRVNITRNHSFLLTNYIELILMFLILME